MSSLEAGVTPAARRRLSSPWALQPRTFMPMRAAERGHAGADGAHAEHAERLAEELGEHLARPLARAHLGVERVILRATASMSVSACSATAKALTPGVLQTVTPRMPAAFRSMLSVPVPHTETILSAGQAANTASLNRACARMLMATCARSMRRISSFSSSAPRSVNRRTAPSFFARSSAAEPAKTDGKSSGTTIMPRPRRSAPGPRPRRRRARSCGRGRGASARAPTASAARTWGST